MEGFGFEGGAVGGDEEPVGDFAAEEVDAAEGGEFAAEVWVVGADAFGEDQPEAVVLGVLRTVAEHEDEAVGEIDGEAGEHAADFGVERLQRVEDEGVGDFGAGFGGAWRGWHGLSRRDDSITGWPEGGFVWFCSRLRNMTRSTETVNVHEAKTHLSRIIERVVASGEPVTIARAGKPVAIVSAHPEARPARRRLGILRGKVRLPEELGARDAEIEEMFEGGKRSGRQ